MDLATFHPVFLFLGLLQAAVAIVAPPTNVTLDCQNLHNVLKWSYDPGVTGVKFKVDIGAQEDLDKYPPELWVEPPAPLQVDVSFLSDPSNAYFLQVTAKIGENESEPAPTEGIQFSYFQNSAAVQKCFVDFPSLNITAEKDNYVRLRFTHPWLLYHPKWKSGPSTKSRKKKSHDAQISQQLPLFEFDVQRVINTKTRHHMGHCDERVCEELVLMDSAEKKHCLKVKGEVEKILVQETQQYCVDPLTTTPNALIYGILGSVLILGAVSLVIFMIYRKKTRPSTSIPTSMTFADKLKRQFIPRTNEGMTVDVADLEQPSSPTPLLTKEEQEMTSTTPPPSEPEVRLRCGVSPKDGGESGDVEKGNGEAPEYMAGRDLEDDEQPEAVEDPSGEEASSSGYERRPVFVELGPDETAEGYRG